MNKNSDYCKVEEQISKWKNDLEKILRSKELFDDTHFHDYSDYFDSEPSDFPVLFVLTSEGQLWHGLNYGDSEIENFIDDYIGAQEYYYEIHSSCIFLFYLKDECNYQEYSNYFQWKWNVKNLKSEYGILHTELYKKIQDNSESIFDLCPREFEHYISKIFKDKGYKTILGPGTNDKGIDLRIVTKDDEKFILVQIKQYDKKYPIHLDPVKALCWDVYHEDEKAESGLFITTSRFLPGVEKFAENKKIKLATMQDILRWNMQALKNNKQKVDQLNDIKHLILKDLEENVDIATIKEKILYHTWGYNMIINDFYLIITEIENIALVIKLESEQETDIYGQIGYEIPKITNKLKDLEVMFARKKENNCYSMKELYLMPWDGKQMYFNYMD